MSIDVEQAKKDLEAAAKEVETRGHCQGQFYDNGHICMMQSLYLGSGFQENPQGPTNKANGKRLSDVKAAVQSVLPSLVSICAWNNEPGRTGAEVAAKLREAAAKVGTEAPSAA